MKRLITNLILLTCVCNAAALAQRPMRKKSAPPAQRTVSRYLDRPFDISLETLPAGFNGHDPEVLYKILATRNTTATKGEFETTAQYQSRVGVEAARPLYGEVATDSALAFVVGRVESLYDADHQTLKVTVKFRKAWEGYGVQTPRMSLAVKNASMGNRDYTGSNAYGAQVRVKELTSADYNIAFINYAKFPVTQILSDAERKLMEQEEKSRRRLLQAGVYLPASTDSYGERAFAVEFQMDAAMAIRAKKNLRMLAVVRLQAPYTITGALYSKPTFDRPTEYFSKFFFLNTELLELWFYDAATGKVFAKEQAQ
jgi:hypothetical protein